VLPGLTSITYDDQSPWPIEADGVGKSIVYQSGDPSLPRNWQASHQAGGSPGSDEPPSPETSLRTLAFGDREPRTLPDQKFAFPVNQAAQNLQYTLQWSHDLTTWHTDDKGRFSLLGDEPLDGDYHMRVYEDTQLGEQVYVRLQASRR
ncbi:MAG: hypothetical protein AAF492_15775, partial [Verrucomicrobiota bacterium]